jgi:hypothetical protein
MAEIRVERKKRSSVLPWLLALLVLALAIWAVTEMMDDDREDAVREAEDVSALETVVPAPLPVAVFAVSFGRSKAKATSTVPEIRAA